jgi:cytoplasmic iron level regulating protein YaaA (DUF328/UPF0246 family)
LLFPFYFCNINPGSLFPKKRTMIHVLSPAKSLDFETPAPYEAHTSINFSEESERLVKKARTLSKKGLEKLMGISKSLAELNHQRFQDWEVPIDAQQGKQALFAFTGDVYRGLDALSLSEKDIEFAQEHQRILSGLYGILKPLDLMLAYRLEMGTSLPVGRKKNLYDFWGSKLTDFLNKELEGHKDQTLVNLASNEYFKAIKVKELKGKLISPQFKDAKNGEYKTIMTFAKQARGYMSRYIIQNKIDRAEDLLGFDLNGYRYNQDLSTESEPVFTREENQRA